MDAILVNSLRPKYSRRISIIIIIIIITQPFRTY